jgi:hypothetical protein
MKLYRFSPALLTAVLLVSAQPLRAQTTLNFNSLASTCSGLGYNAYVSPYVEQGFQLAFGSLSYYSWCTNQSNSPLPAGNAAIFAGAGDIVTLTKVGGGTFGLSSIDLASVFGSGGSVVFTGFLSGGGTVTSGAQPFDAWPGSNATLRTDPFSGFNNLTSVTFAQSQGGPYYQFDNVVVTSVTPEPATMSLMAAGLVAVAGAGLRRRKRA